MKNIPYELSIVIVGEDCNPTILNPDFLKYQGIVPDDWGWELLDAPITTRAMSIVAYTSGIIIKVEPNRFQVTDNSGVIDVTKSQALQIARRYIEVLPHVRYTAVGTNFRNLVEMDDPHRFLKEKFIKAGPWNQDPYSLRDVNFAFVYAHDEARLTITLESASLLHRQDDQIEQTLGLGIAANYHRECHDYPTHEQVFAHLERLGSDAVHFGTMMNDILLADL